MAILKLRDKKTGQVIEIPAFRGEKGDTGSIENLESEVEKVLNKFLPNISIDFTCEIVTTLPEPSEAQKTTIYLILDNDNIYNEYICINGSWKHIGNTAIDLSNVMIKFADVVVPENGPKILADSCGFKYYQCPNDKLDEVINDPVFGVEKNSLQVYNGLSVGNKQYTAGLSVNEGGSGKGYAGMFVKDTCLELYPNNTIKVGRNGKNTRLLNVDTPITSTDLISQNDIPYQAANKKYVDNTVDGLTNKKIQNLVHEYNLNNIKIVDQNSVTRTVMSVSSGRKTDIHWSYVKWNDGRCEMYGYCTIYPSNVSSLNQMSYSELFRVNLPVSVKNRVVVGTAGDLCWVCNVGSGVNELLSTSDLRIASPRPISQAFALSGVAVNLVVYGRWK